MMVLITRPLAQSLNLQGKLKAINVDSLIFPTLNIEPVTNKNSLLAGIKALPNSQVVIFTSSNAVHFTMPYWPKFALENLQIVAMGPATAKTLGDFNINVNYTAPPPYTSEALLTLPIFKNVENKRVIIFKGEGGRTLLTETLQQHSAIVFEAFSYRRIVSKVLPENLKKNWQKIGIILITSGESLTALMGLFFQDPKSLLQKILVVPSYRILALAKELGFEKILHAPNPTDEAIFDTINSYLKAK